MHVDIVIKNRDQSSFNLWMNNELDKCEQVIELTAIDNNNNVNLQHFYKVYRKTKNCYNII